eukprot:3403874-Rhodomonas_salina.1
MQGMAMSPLSPEASGRKVSTVMAIGSVFELPAETERNRATHSNGPQRTAGQHQIDTDTVLARGEQRLSACSERGK